MFLKCIFYVQKINFLNIRPRMKIPSFIKRKITLILRKYGFIKNKNLRTFLEGVIISYIQREGQITIIQVGANDGIRNDPLHDIITEFNNHVKLLAIEPQEKIFLNLKKNLSDLKNISFSNKLVGDSKKKNFYSIKDSPDTDGISSVEKSNLLKRYPEEKIIHNELQSYTLNQIIDEFDEFKKVDLLNIDAEGHDDQIIYNTDLNKIELSFINYEYKNLSNSRHAKLRDYLISKGFEIIKWNTSDEIAIRKKA